MLNAGDIGLNLLFNREGLNNQIRNLASSLSSALGIGLSTVALVNFTKSSLELGSDLAEVQNVVDVTFGNMAEDINEFASTAITQLGLSETSAKQYASTMGAMLKSMGLSTNQALEMSKAITSLSADMASFYNLDNDTAFEKIRAGISGETEPLKALGINMSVANMEAYALSQGINKAYDSMTQSEQAILRYNYLLSVTADAQGDFARTSNSWANQTRILTEQWNAFKATMGQAFINILSPVVKWLNIVISKLQIAANTFKSFINQVTGNTDSSNATASIANNLASATDGANSLTDGLDNATDSAKEVVKEVNRLQGFDEINLLSKSNNSGGNNPVDMDISSIGNGGNEQISKTTDEAKEMSTVFDEIINKVKKLNEFLNPTKIALQGLSGELKRLGVFAFDGLKDFYNSFLKPVAAWTIGEGLPRFINAITNGLAKVNWQKINDSLHDLWIALTPFAINIGEGLLWFWENILVPFGTWTLNDAVPAFLDLLSGAIAVLNPILEVFMELGEWLWNEFLQPIASWTGGVIISVLEGLANALKDIGEWMSNNKSIVEGITVAVLAFFGAWAVGKIKEFIDLSGGLCGALVQIATKLASTTLAQNLYNIAQGVGNVLTTAWNGLCVIASGVTTALGIAFNFLCSPIGLVTLAITGAIAVGVLLYKNWDTIKEKASELWENIKNVFDKIKDKIKSVCDSIKGFFKGMINFVVEVINKLINGINKISIDLPDWDILPDSIQGKSFNPNIPQIPMLAEGGFVEANTPQLAMIGDNTKYGEIVAPENKLSELLDKAVSKGSADEETLYRAFLRALNDMPRQQTEVKIGESTLMWIIINGLNKIIKQNGGVCPINI